MREPPSGSWRKPRAPRGPAIIAFVYLAAGALWILFSDRLTESLAHDVATLSRLQTYKGWFYVLATAILLYVMVAAYVRRIRRAENEIRRLNEDLERRVAERTAQLEAANHDLEAFSYSVSHDLRAPLRAIDGFSRILLEDYGPALDPEAQRLLGVVRNNTLKMAQLIDDLLTFSRTSRAELRPVLVDMTALARKVADETLAQEQGRTIDLRIGQLPEAHCDRAMMRQVFVNLLSNAVKFTRTRDVAVIEVDGWTENAENIYRVKDNGVGFDPQYADKLFGVFQRLHRMEDFGGTGVGLALVHRIVTRHGGRVWAESEPDKGAAFYFALPAAPNDENKTANGHS